MRNCGMFHKTAGSGNSVMGERTPRLVVMLGCFGQHSSKRLAELSFINAQSVVVSNLLDIHDTF